MALMRQVVLDSRDGSVSVVTVPEPALRPGGVLVRVKASLISAGTERAKVQLGHKNLLQKALERPDQVRQVVESVRRDGLLATYRKVQLRLDQWQPIGYSASGVVQAVAPDVRGWRVGDRVAVGGGGYANHAEVVFVPANLCARIPEALPFDQAAFATVGAIALHGLRQADTALGETLVVIGLGLVGQLTVMLGRAAGCRVLGVDLLPERVELARRLGAEAAVDRPGALLLETRRVTANRGADAVVITAATKSDEPIRWAGHVARDRATVVAVGAVGLKVPRDLYFRKELTLLQSRSYGPGRYDVTYEESGNDYPIGYVRWTEGRNLEGVLQLAAEGRLDLGALVQRRYSVLDAAAAYEALASDPGGALGVVLLYDAPAPPAPPPAAAPSVSAPRGVPKDVVRVGMVGAGGFALSVLAPALQAARGCRLIAIASASGLSAADAARRLGIPEVVGPPEAMLERLDLDAIVIATRHDSHAALAAAALRRGLAVFVEKPLALSWEQLEDVQAALEQGTAPLMVGFNRRFAPLTTRLLQVLGNRSGAALIQVRVNAGAAARDHWTQDPRVGGGRLLGEGCHFVDLVLALAGTTVRRLTCQGITAPDADADLGDNFALTMELADGSVGSLVYTSRGDARSGKERVELFADGASAALDDFRRLVVVRDGRRTTARSPGDKGHREEIRRFVEAVRTAGPMPITVPQLLHSTAATLTARDSLTQGGAWQDVPA